MIRELYLNPGNTGALIIIEAVDIIDNLTHDIFRLTSNSMSTAILRDNILIQIFTYMAPDFRQVSERLKFSVYSNESIGQLIGEDLNTDEKQRILSTLFETAGKAIWEKLNALGLFQIPAVYQFDRVANYDIYFYLYKDDYLYP